MKLYFQKVKRLGKANNMNTEFCYYGNLGINVSALNRGTSIYLTNLLGMFDVLTEQEIAKVKPYIY